MFIRIAQLALLLCFALLVLGAEDYYKVCHVLSHQVHSAMPFLLKLRLVADIVCYSYSA